MAAQIEAVTGNITDPLLDGMTIGIELDAPQSVERFEVLGIRIAVVGAQR